VFTARYELGLRFVYKGLNSIINVEGFFAAEMVK
jgi:hypothetical protein